MRLPPITRKLFVPLLFVLVASPLALSVPAKTEEEKVASVLSARLAEQTVAVGKTQPSQSFADENARAAFFITDAAQRAYRTGDGDTFSVEIVRTRTDAAAYALLTAAAEQMRRASGQVNVLNDLGTYGFATTSRVAFFRGTNFISIEPSCANCEGQETSYIIRAARELDAKIIGDVADEGDVPVLVKHLPDWEQVQARVSYAVSLDGLQGVIGRQPILEGYDFGGGTEAVVASYPSEADRARLVIIEHLTPQIAADNERLVAARAESLRAASTIVPAHRRIGNYLVFVFDAPDEATAKELMGRVKYEQDVRWLGDNPFAQERAERAYTMMSLGVLVASLKSAGVGILLCLGIGSIVGSIVFMRRRAQSMEAATYSDAGGMVRLGIDNLTRTETEPARLLPPPER